MAPLNKSVTRLTFRSEDCGSVSIHRNHDYWLATFRSSLPSFRLFPFWHETESPSTRSRTCLGLRLIQNGFECIPAPETKSRYRSAGRPSGNVKSTV